MSRDLGRDVPDLEKLYAIKLWADFSYPSFCRLLISSGNQRISIWSRGFSQKIAATRRLSQEIAAADVCRKAGFLPSHFSHGGWGKLYLVCSL